MTPIYEQTFTGTPGELRTAVSTVLFGKRKEPPKKRILFLVDNHNWCWSSTARNIAKHLPQYTWQIETQREFRRHAEHMMAMADLIYLRGYPAAFFDGLRVPITKPWIWTLCTGGANLDRRLEESREYINLAAGCIVQCNAAKESAIEAGATNVHLIPNGVDTKHFAPYGSRFVRNVVGFAGNDSGDRLDLKGSDLVRKAAQSISMSYDCATKSNRLTYDEMPGFYNSLSIYAQPSAAEGCSNSVMEAMSCGIPCLIVKGVGYHGETCNDRQVIFVERTVESVTYGLVTAMDFNIMPARQFAECHDWSQVAGLHADIIESVDITTKTAKTKTISCANCKLKRRIKRLIEE